MENTCGVLPMGAEVSQLTPVTGPQAPLHLRSQLKIKHVMIKTKHG
jgi:hypothetical protein